MPSPQDPSELTLRQTFRQARFLARRTSRVRNRDWYRPALDIDRQWHVLVDGTGTTQSYLYDRRKDAWCEGPEIPASLLTPAGNASDAEAEETAPDLGPLLQQILRDRRLGARARSLGLILHVADELATGDFSAEYSVDDDFDHVRNLLAESPHEVIGDASIGCDEHSWRMLPLWGQHEGERRSIALVLSRRYHPFLRAAEKYGDEIDVPVIVHELASPLAVLPLLPSCIRQEPSSGNIILLQYPRFTALAVLDRQGELVQVRSLNHRGESTCPAAPGEVLANMAASVNLDAPAVSVVPMGEVDSEGLLRELTSHPAISGQVEIAGLELPGSTGEPVPGGRAEFLLANPAEAMSGLEDSTFSGSVTFAELARGWAVQNFHQLAPEEANAFPSRQELVLLNLLGSLKWTLGALTIALGILAGYEVSMMSRAGLGGQTDTDLAQKRLELGQLVSEEKRVSFWESMMVPRSEGWTAVELVLRLIPEDSSILLTSCNYKVEGDPPRNRAKKQIGYRRTWVMEGYCQGQARAHLIQLSSRSHVEKAFEELAQTFGRDAFATGPDTREITVTMEQKQSEYPGSGLMPAKVARLYQTKFTLTITQSMEPKDELALTINPPKPQADSPAES